MKIEIIYPPVEKSKRIKQKMITICKWLFLFSGFICIVLNITTGAKAWSTVVIWSLFLIYKQLIATDMVEYNRISQTIKFVINTSILLFLIELFLVSGWAVEVVSIVWFSSLVVIFVLLFTDFEAQSQNIFPLLVFCVLCLIGSVVGISFRLIKSTWILALSGALSLCLLVGCLAKTGKQFFEILKKIFCAK